MKSCVTLLMSCRRRHSYGEGRARRQKTRARGKREKRKGMSHLSFCYWHFLCDTLCVLVFHADLKPLLWGAYVKDCRPPDVMPPGTPRSCPQSLLTTLLIYWPPQLLSASLSLLFINSSSFLYFNQASLHHTSCHIHISTHVYISLFTLFSPSS